jgi:Right handed beta helix region
VLVGPGTYLENLSIVGKDLVLKSEMGPEATILDGSSRQETVIYLSGQTRAMVVTGFTITGGAGRSIGSVVGGGGLALEGGASPIIRGNQIVENGKTGITRFGGGIRVRTADGPASPSIEDNLIAGNSADLGAGVSTGNGMSDFRGNVFRDNTCNLDGGAIYAVFNSGFLTIEGNQFWENYAGDHGGALHIGGTSASEVRIAFNLFVRNQSEGLDTGNTGSGGAMRLAFVRGMVVNNTIVEGLGPSSSSGCEGGGISLEDTPADLDISSNIIALNDDCGIACRFSIENALGQNLFWMNENADLGFGLGECPSEWAANQLFANPYFCAPQLDNYRLAANSPGIGMGAFPEAACPGVPVQPTTWGQIKALYR